MQQPVSQDGSNQPQIDIARSDRWLIHHRLQELMIPSYCLADGSLRVEVNHGLALLLVRSTVQHVVAPRQELVCWLERCWTSHSGSHPAHHE